MSDRLAAALASIEGRIGPRPDIALILGSGLDGLADAVTRPVVIPYAEIAGFPVPTAPGHAGRLVIGGLHGRRVALMQGRLHLYEGWSAADIALTVRLLRRLGATQLAITNAAGALNPELAPGAVMLIEDHLNLTGANPLTGTNEDALGLRFPDMSRAYDPGMREAAQVAAEAAGVELRHGIYAGIAGPSLETSAERRFLRAAGADAVGMSTVIEVIAAVHCGFRVLGFSAIANAATGGPDQAPDTIEEVLAHAGVAGGKIAAILARLLPEILIAMPGKARSVALAALAQVLAMSLWFVSAAILPEIVAEGGLGPGRAALLSSAVQIGFVAGALALAVHGTADRFDPRRVMAGSALLGAGANALLLVTPVGGIAQVLLRALTGACLAGVYPVGMKIAIGWGERDRGLLVALLVGAVTLGSALPHLLAFLGGPDWRATVLATSVLAALAALCGLGVALGPHHARAPCLDAGALALAWTDRRVRLAYAGYLGHMWELYAFWAWIGVAAAVAFAPLGDAASGLARLLTFAAIALGAVACLPAGWLADRIGKARVAQGAMAASAAAGLATAASFGGPAWLVVALVLAWGAAVIPDSAQFSALVADAAPPERAGSLLTLQTALGFTLTFFTVQAVPSVAAVIGWPWTLALMTAGPLLGVEAMRRLIRLPLDPGDRRA